MAHWPAWSLRHAVALLSAPCPSHQPQPWGKVAWVWGCVSGRVSTASRGPRWSCDAQVLAPLATDERSGIQRPAARSATSWGGGRQGPNGTVGRELSPPIPVGAEVSPFVELGLHAQCTQCTQRLWSAWSKPASWSACCVHSLAGEREEGS